MKKYLRALIIAAFCFNAVCSSKSFAQVAFLPAPGTMVNFSPKFEPLLVKGVKLFPDNPFKFEFIVNIGEKDLTQEQIRQEGQKLSSYFLAALTTPEKEMWVNLSPYEKDRLIPVGLGDTEMGKELLAQDYILKQIMATALYPERQLGRAFWAKVYQQIYKQYGGNSRHPDILKNVSIKVGTFNKVWVLPKEAIVYDNAKANTVFIAKSSLKVMLEEDYLAAQTNAVIPVQTGIHSKGDVASQIIRDIILPELEREVNEGVHFVKLRQIYQLLILASWYKKNLSANGGSAIGGKDNVLGLAYVDQNKTKGIANQDKNINQKIYQQYLKAYKTGVYNYVKEDIDPATGRLIPKKFFSGGVEMNNLSQAMVIDKRPDILLSMRGGLKRLMSIITIAVILATANTGSPEASDLPSKVPQNLSNVKVSTYGWPGIDMHLLDKFMKNGQVHDPNRAFVVAANLWPINHYLKITHRNIKDGNLIETQAIVKIADTGPIKNFGHPDGSAAKVRRAADLSKKTWQQITGEKEPGIAWVDIEYLGEGPIAVGIIDRVKYKLGSSASFDRLVEDRSAKMAAEPGMLNRFMTAVLNAVSWPTMLRNAIDGVKIPKVKLSSNTGGIDLKEINLRIRSDKGGVKTAFTDPKILEALRNAQGLEPNVQQVRPLSGLVLDAYIGLGK